MKPNSINIFCFVSNIINGQTNYIDSILSDKKFVRKTQLSKLVYGTTRKDYQNNKEFYYVPLKEYNDVTQNDDLVEFRSYYIIPDGDVYFFTKKSDIVNAKTNNLICICTPYQYENYRTWCSLENIKRINSYNLNLVIINADMKSVFEEQLAKTKTRLEILELCRQVMQDDAEFEDAKKRFPEFIDPMSCSNVCMVSDFKSDIAGFNANLEKIKGFILEMTKK